jgi:hypothetical protein
MVSENSLLYALKVATGLHPETDSVCSLKPFFSKNCFIVF